jgi:murein DD-endopeptidase MepM/ murein hydrolase activator NlpD
LKDLVLSNRNFTFQELIVDYNLESLSIEYSLNDNRGITFEIPKTKRNAFLYDKILPDMLLIWEDQYYTIITSDEAASGNQRTKTVEAKHIFMESQYIYIERDLSKDKINEDVEDIETDDNGVVKDKKKKKPNEDVSDSIADSNIDVVADKIYKFLINKGMAKYQIYGILGNAKAESGMNPAAEQVEGDPDRGGKGLFQWDDRKYNLYKFAENNNTTWQDPDVQLKFMWSELNSTEAYAMKKLEATNNTREAALAFHRYFERSADDAKKEKRRVTYALEYRDMFEDSDNSPDEVANSDWLDISKGINYGFGQGGAYEQETGVARHDGIDLNYVYDPVYSVIKGLVKVGWDPRGYGNYVMISDGAGLDVIYGHLSEVHVTTNQQVVPGTPLGISGNTGFSTGPHLHFEMRKNGVAFDPMNWIRSNKGGTISDDDMTNTGATEDAKDLYSVDSYLDYGFKNNNAGFTYEIVGDFPDFKAIDKIGDRNLLQHIVDGANVFGYIYYADNKNIKIYDKATFYKFENYPIVFKYNSDDLQVKTNITDLETFIRGYGGKKNTSDTKNYNPIRNKDLKLKGNFNKKGTWNTEEVGSYYESDFVAKYGNETLQWNLKKGKKGGTVTVYLDGEKVNSFNQYNEEAGTDKVILKRGLEKGKHNIKVEFSGASNGVDYEEKKPVMYVQTNKSDVFNLTAVLSGKEVYNFYAEYKSPLYDTYTPREAPTVYEDSVKSEDELKKIIKEKIKEEPTVEVSTNYLSYDKIEANSKVRLVHKEMGFNTDLEVVELKKGHPRVNKPVEVTFTNNRTDILKYQRALNQAVRKMELGG